MFLARSSAAVPARLPATRSPAISDGSPARTAESTCASATSAMYAGAQLMTPIAMSIWLSSTVTTGPTRPNSSSACAVELGVRVVVARVADDALAHLDRHARQHPDDRRPAVGGLERRERHAAEDRDHALRRAAELRGDAFQAGRLVAEHDDVRALRELGIGRDDLAAELGDQRLGARRVEVVDEHGITPATRERSRHVARPDKADLHMRGTVPVSPYGPTYD